MKKWQVSRKKLGHLYLLKDAIKEPAPVFLFYHLQCGCCNSMHNAESSGIDGELEAAELFHWQGPDYMAIRKVVKLSFSFYNL